MAVTAREAIGRLKPYVGGKPAEEVQRELGLSDVVKLSSNENPLGPSPQALAAVRESLPGVHLYPDLHYYHLKRTLAGHLEVPEEWIICGNGSDDLIRLVAETFLEPGAEAVLPTPSFSTYEYAVRLVGANPVFVPLRDWVHDLEAMARAITPRTRLVVICNPNNPTGTIVGDGHLRAFLDRVPPGVLVAIDEAYHDYADDPDFPRSLELVREQRDVVLWRTFSKIYGLAGMRLGYAVSCPGIIRPLAAAWTPFAVNRLAQVAGAAALADQAHRDRSRRLNRDEKEFLYRELSRLGLSYLPTQANFILIDLARPCRPVYQALLARGVIVRPAESFGLPGHIRVTIGRRTDNERFIAALAAVLEQA